MPLHDPARAFVPYPDVPVARAGTGPLSGLAFAVKDLFDVAGYPTGCGSPHMLARSGIKTQHAAAVQALLDAGARFIGKTVTDELAFSLNGQNAHFGYPINGAAPDRISGGSSSGSASAVSHGLCDLALGSDTGGSVRGPASHCGIFGIRPTHGRIDLTGCHDLSPSLDTCGYFAKEGTSFERASAILLGQDPHPLDLAQSPTLMLPEDLWALVEPDAAAVARAALPAIEQAFGSLSTTSVTLDDLDSMFWAFRYIQGYEAWRVNGAFIERDQPMLGPGVKERFAWSSKVTPAQFEQSVQFRARFKEHMNQLLAGGRVLLFPTMPNVAPLVTQPESSLEDYRNRALRMLCVSGLSGLPQVSVPGLQVNGVPLGMSVLGPAGSDLSLVQLAVQIHRALA